MENKINKKKKSRKKMKKEENKHTFWRDSW